MRSRALSIAEELVRGGRERAEALRQAIERTQRMGDARDAIGTVPPAREFHVVASKGQWVLRSEAETENEQFFDSKDKAVDKGVNKAKNMQGNLYVHDETGAFDEIHSFAKPNNEVGEGILVRLNSLEDLYVEQLQDLYSGEEQLIVALERLANKASNSQLKKAFRSHLEETREQKTKLEQVFGRLGERPGKETCEGMAGIIFESEELIQSCDDPDTCDAGLIAIAQRAEHYEIAGYGSAVTYAKRLDHKEDVKVLEKILAQEKKADEKLTEVAEKVVNPKAEKKAKSK